MTLCGSIDIGTSTLASCIVEKTRSGIRVLRYESIPRPAEYDNMIALLRELALRMDFSHVRKIAVNIDYPVFVRNLEFPFTDIKKVEPLVPYELDDQIPGEVENMVVVTNPVVLKDKTEVLAVAVTKKDVKDQLHMLKQVGVDAYRLVHPAARSIVIAGAETGCTVVVDIGAFATHLTAVIDGRIRFVRTWAEGMESVVSALSVYSSQNEDVVRNWFVSSGHIQPPTIGEEGYEEVIRTVMARAFEEWRRFMLQVQTRCGVPISRFVLAGGGANLAGLASVASSFFEIPVQIAQIPGDLADPKRASVVAQALLCLQPEILNFRRGEFAYGVKDSVIRKKALAIAWGLGTFFLMLSLSSMFTLWRLEKEERNALQQLGHMSSEVLGKTIYNPSSIRKQIKQRIQKGRLAGGSEQLPNMSAWTVMSLISQNLPENALRHTSSAMPGVTPKVENTTSADGGKPVEQDKNNETGSQPDPNVVNDKLESGSSKKDKV